MDLKECYIKLEGNYDLVMANLLSEDRVRKFVFKFVDDKSFDELTENLKMSKYKDAFRAVHTLKGVCQNLSLTKLANSSSDLCEMLRHYQGENYSNLYNKVKEDYIQTVSTIKEYKDAFQG